MFTPNIVWNIEKIWRSDGVNANLIVYQISPTSGKSKPATVVIRERYEFQGLLRLVVFAKFGPFDPENLPWETNTSQNLKIT